eukprot:GFYU01015229.1.p1 GENE.GFYU01015229.1~~GFYU01015229.1.p1  ORF type:complete len:250 (+),score=40.02 GFYU01015229.1:70-819(+)
MTVTPGTYEIHDNGGRPWRVQIAESGAVAVCEADWEKDIYKEEPVLTFQPDRIFIGKSPEHDPEFGDGNTILMRLDGLKYVVMSNHIFSFVALSEIAEFWSPIGNSDVPYPYAVDIDGRYYLLEGDKNGAVLSSVPIEHKEDPYTFYYDQCLITNDEGCNPTRCSPHGKWRGIQEYYIGEDKYTLTYTPEAGADFDGLSGEGEMKLVYEGGPMEKVLSRGDYIELMEEFGRMIGAHKLSDVSILRNSPF